MAGHFQARSLVVIHVGHAGYRFPGRHKPSQLILHRIPGWLLHISLAGRGHLLAPHQNDSLLVEHAARVYTY